MRYIFRSNAKALSTAYTHECITRNTSLFVLWMKCRNSEGVSGEQKRRSAEQGGRVLKKDRVKHILRKTSRHLCFNKKKLGRDCFA
jgi:hypothetical protein